MQVNIHIAPKSTEFATKILVISLTSMAENNLHLFSLKLLKVFLVISIKEK